MDLTPTVNLVNLLFFAYLVNLPLGYIREGTPKYSARWFLYIHLSIPLIVAVRLTHGFGWDVVPYSLLLAIFGQWSGGRIYRRRHP